MDVLILSFIAAAEIFNLPPGLQSAVCHVESGHRTHVIHHHDGKGNSLGVCQIKLSTARTLGYTGTATQLMDPEGNIYWSAKYLRKQLSRYPGDISKAVAAYNSGSYKESSIIKGKARNQAYVNKVFNAWAENR